MNHCAYCNAPLLSVAQICPKCGNEQPPYPPILPGGGGKSYRGWAYILISIGTGLLILGIAMFLQQPYSLASAQIYGSPSASAVNNPAYLTFLGAEVYPGWGYLIFFGGIAAVLYFNAARSISRGRRIDAANPEALRALKQYEAQQNR